MPMWWSTVRQWRRRCVRGNYVPDFDNSA